MKYLKKLKVRKAARNLFRKQPIGLMTEKKFISFVIDDIDYFYGSIGKFVREKWLEAAAQYLSKNFPIPTKRKTLVANQLASFASKEFEVRALVKAAGLYYEPGRTPVCSDAASLAETTIR